MKRTDIKAFADFMQDEAVKYGRTLTQPEIATYFENFPRVSLEDFKVAWVEHKRDEKRGHFFPTIVDIQRRVKNAGQEQAKRDWRCSEEQNGERCGFPGAVNMGHGWQCGPHSQLAGGVNWTVEASLQIIEQSRDYSPPKTVMELMTRGAARRAADGERWRKANPAIYREMDARRETVKRIGASTFDRAMPRPTEPEEPLPQLDNLDEANDAAALAAQGDR